MRGPVITPAAILVRQSSSCPRLLPRSRTPVTPLATRTGSALAVVQLRWTCMSHRPGMRNWPRPSTTFAPFGAAPPCSTVAMRPSRTTTVMSARGGPPAVSMTVTWVKAMSAAAASLIMGADTSRRSGCCYCSARRAADLVELRDLFRGQCVADADQQRELRLLDLALQRHHLVG